MNHFVLGGLSVCLYGNAKGYRDQLQALEVFGLNVQRVGLLARRIGLLERRTGLLGALFLPEWGSGYRRGLPSEAKSL